MTHTVVTCVFAASPELEAGALRSLDAVSKVFQDDVRVAALDVSTPQIDALCREKGWQTLLPDKGLSVPRMRHLLRKAVDQSKTDIVWTIEHDCLPTATCRRVAELVLCSFRNVGGVECNSFDEEGNPCPPCLHKSLRPFANETEVKVLRPWASLNCVAWRGSALRNLAWYRVREYPVTDQDISAQMLSNGWELVLLPNAICIHLETPSRAVLSKLQTRSLSEIRVLTPTGVS